MASSDINKIVDDIIDEETPDDNPNTPQDERAVVTNDPTDKGGRTQWGIAEHANPAAWADGKVTEAEARAIYVRKYIAPFNGLQDHLAFPALVDWGVTSGPGLVVQNLQRVVGTKVDAKLGPQTLAAIQGFDPRLLANRMVAERVKMIGRIVKRDPSQLKYINGWLDRVLGFLI